MRAGVCDRLPIHREHERAGLRCSHVGEPLRDPGNGGRGFEGDEVSTAALGSQLGHGVRKHRTGGRRKIYGRAETRHDQREPSRNLRGHPGERVQRVADHEQWRIGRNRRDRVTQPGEAVGAIRREQGLKPADIGGVAHVKRRQVDARAPGDVGHPGRYGSRAVRCGGQQGHARSQLGPVVEAV